MASTIKTFSVGEIRCTAISDGNFSYPTGWFFSNVGDEPLKGSLREHNLPQDQVVSPYTCLLITSGVHKVLVDTGADGLAPTTGNLMRNLSTAGVDPTEITTVVLTHGHADHIGGVLDSEGAPAFPNARYVMSRAEWHFWTAAADLSNTGLNDHVKELLINCAQKNLPPLKERMELLDRDKEIIPGLYATLAPGHTPGHIALLISSGTAQFLHVADSVLHPLHLENPSWRNVFDLDEDLAVTTRQRLLDRACAEKANILAYHFPFPSIGAVNRSGTSWKWEPVSS